MMLENLDLGDLNTIATSLPGPHAWAWGTADIFCCRACGTCFEFGVEPVPGDPCEPIEQHGEVLLKVGDDWLTLDEFIARYGRAAADRRLGEAGMQLP